MATEYWKCEACGCIREAETFQLSDSCPDCGEPEDVFIYRRYRCKGCGKEGAQVEFFPNEPADDDPLECGVLFLCSRCGSSGCEQILVRVQAGMVPPSPSP